MGYVRPPAVAGMFYPADGAELDRAVKGFLARVPPSRSFAVPKAIIAPHAGYVSSGPVPAKVYARLAPARGQISRVALLGPSHRVGFRGLAVTGADAYLTPLGPVPIDKDAVAGLLKIPGVGQLDAAHKDEHSLEVHIPFLQEVLGDFSLVPVVAGEARPEEVARVIEALWGGPESLIVVSSDLSHYLDYESAKRIDAMTAAAIENFDCAAIGHDQACGRVPVWGLLTVAKKKGLSVATLDVRNSGDTAGGKGRVVGYGSWAFFEPGALFEPGAGS